MRCAGFESFFCSYTATRFLYLGWLATTTSRQHEEINYSLFITRQLLFLLLMMNGMFLYFIGSVCHISTDFRSQYTRLFPLATCHCSYKIHRAIDRKESSLRRHTSIEWMTLGQLQLVQFGRHSLI